MSSKEIDIADDQPSIEQKLHSETAIIAWSELQRFFAQGSVLLLSSSLDLVMVASYMAQDDSDKLKPIIDAGDLAAPTNQQARNWFDSKAELWSVVVAPFVLIQEMDDKTAAK